MHKFKNIQGSAYEVDMQGRIVAGYAATWTLDSVGDVIQKGAFAKTIKERQAQIKVMRNHQTLIGKPLVMAEDDTGLYTESYIAETPAGEETLQLIKAGALNEMSIQFLVPQGKEQQKEGANHISEIKLLEYGPVDMPANEAAVLVGLKMVNQAIALGDQVKDQTSLAKAIDELSALLKHLQPQAAPQPPEQNDLSDIIAEIKNLAAISRTKII
jgi:HK97 family phage prohead protease